MDTDPATTYAGRAIANAAYVAYVECDDGGPPMLIYSSRPLAEGIAELFRAAIRHNKPVPTVLGRPTRPAPLPAALP